MNSPKTVPAPSWQWNEVQQVGADYTDPAEIEAYDVRHGKFRDFAAEAERIFSLMPIRADQTLLDMGAGTGNFALEAARRCRHVYAADVSAPMLDYAREKAQRAGVSNISFHQGGFLTYRHGDEPVDCIVSQAALHHLPDFWKLVGLRRLRECLAPGGRFLLMDVVFAFEPDALAAAFDAILAEAAVTGVERLAGDWVRHLRQEFSTWSWIMEGILERAGFRIASARYDRQIAVYLCERLD